MKACRLFSGLLAVLLSAGPAFAQPSISFLPAWTEKTDQVKIPDWLVVGSSVKAGIYRDKDNKDIILDNGLLRRTFRITPNVACTGFRNLSNGEELLRSVKPEATITIDGKNWSIGGLYGQKENAYLLPSWVDGFSAGNNDFHCTAIEVKNLEPYLTWKTRRWASNTKEPSGKTITFVYENPIPALKGITIRLSYDLYDGLPLLCKHLSVDNQSGRTIKINQCVNEILGAVEEESAVVGRPDQMRKPHGIYVESNFAFNNAMLYDLSDQTTHWNTDSTYTSQVNYNYKTPCLLEVYPAKGIGIELPDGQAFRSVRTWEMLIDTYDRERRGLSIRKMYRTIAPWTTENPIFMHLVSTDPIKVKTAVDQCVATGYEAIILSFGSGLNMEDTSAENISKFRELADYAHSRGIMLGGYSLFSSRRISDTDDVIDPVTGKPDAAAFFGAAPCYGSKWGLAYAKKIKTFIEKTGFDLFENDGPYPGDVCASTSHPGHKNLDDSQWRQMEIQKDLYHWCNARDVYVNAPDWYFLDGTNKIAMGYREVNFSFPREQQVILNRQNMYDGTWLKTPSMGWMFVPLTEYQGGGAAATIEPLNDHLSTYHMLMAENYGWGVQACYRGPRLYDTDSTLAMVKKTIDWYKKYRDILNSDVIHLRRADGRDWDGILHVNPALAQKGFLILFNPLNEKITRTLQIPLYYTGLTTVARVKREDGKPVEYHLARDYSIALTVTLEPGSYEWYVIE